MIDTQSLEPQMVPNEPGRARIVPRWQRRGLVIVQMSTGIVSIPDVDETITRSQAAEDAFARDEEYVDAFAGEKISLREPRRDDRITVRTRVRDYPLAGGPVR